MHLGRSIKRRCQFWWEAIRSALGFSMLIIGGMWGLLSFFRDEILPDTLQKTYQLGNLFPQWGLKTWALIGLSALLIVFIEAGYRKGKQLQRELDVLKTPSLSLTFSPSITGCLQPAVRVSETETSMVVRVLVTSSGRVHNCIGKLLKVYKFENNTWNRVPSFAGSLVMNWADFGPIPLTIEQHDERFLEVLYITQHNVVTIAGHNPPALTKDLFNSGGVFRLDMAVAGDEGGSNPISLSFQLGETWDKPMVSELNSNYF